MRKTLLARNFLVVAGLLVVAATGCTAQPSASGQPEERASVADSATHVPTTTSTSPRPVKLPPVTPPGTVLRLGQAAVFPATGSVDEGSLVQVTVGLDSRPVTEADIRRLPLSKKDKAELRGKQFVFVRTDYVNLSGADIRDMDTVLLFPSTRSGGWAGALLQMGLADLVTGCKSGRPDETFNEVGATYSNCEPHFALVEDPVVKLVYDEPPYSEDAPLTWRVR
jgi:hypothetical protein